MDRTTAGKLQAMADDAENMDEEYEFTRWSGRVHQFLLTAVGADEAKYFESLVAKFWPETAAKRRGYLEALLAKFNGSARPTSSFEDKAKALVATAAQVARMQNIESVAEILEQSSATLIQSGSDADNPMIYYTLMLEVPVRIYAQIEPDRESLEQEIAKRLRPIVRPYADNWISEVIISPEVAEGNRREPALELKGGTAEEIPSFWQSGFFRLFISHTSSSKASAHNLKTSLTKFQIASFVAHDDIEPTKEWQAEIERALRTADALAAVVTPDFVESKWCDQEVGIAFGRGKLVIPLRKGADPHGFLGKYQGFQTHGLDAPNVAAEVIEILINHSLTAQRMADTFVEQLAASNTYQKAKAAMSVLERLPNLNSSQIAKLVGSIDANDQVRDAIGVPERIRQLVGKIGKRAPV